MTSVDAVGEISGTSGSGSTSAASQMEALRKQPVVLTRQLKDVAASSADAKARSRPHSRRPSTRRSSASRLRSHDCSNNRRKGRLKGVWNPHP